MLAHRKLFRYQTAVDYLKKFHLFNHDATSTSSTEHEVKTEIPSLRPFVASEHYAFVESKIIKDKQALPSVNIHMPGLEMVAMYYHDKYKTNITLLDVTSEFKSFDFRKAAAEIRRVTALNHDDPYRHAFIVQLGTHSIPIIYMRENKEEGILFADSLESFVTDANLLASSIKMKVYTVLQQRQASDFGCKEDALVFARDTCGLEKKSADFLIPDLLTKIKNRSSPLSSISFQVKLPEELLKTSQLSAFTHFHKEGSIKKIHKGKTIDEFREFYSDKNVAYMNSKGTLVETKEAPAYLRIKGLKLTNIIEIQFYLNQLRNLGTRWTKEVEQQFIADAKETLKIQKKSGAGIGLHTFAENFLHDLLNPTPPNSTSKITVVIDKMGR